jgi:hypothetical protein
MVHNMNINDKFTKMEQSVISELKEVYDPIIMTEEEIHVEFVRISNAIGIEAFEVKDICERWMREELLLSIEQTNRHFSSDSDDNSYK